MVPCVQLLCSRDTNEGHKGQLLVPPGSWEVPQGPYAWPDPQIKRMQDQMGPWYQPTNLFLLAALTPDAVHQSLFMSALSAHPDRSLSMCWEQHCKLLPGVAGISASTVAKWTIEEVRSERPFLFFLLLPLPSCQLLAGCSQEPCSAWLGLGPGLLPNLPPAHPCFPQFLLAVCLGLTETLSSDRPPLGEVVLCCFVPGSPVGKSDFCHVLWEQGECSFTHPSPELHLPHCPLTPAQAAEKQQC